MIVINGDVRNLLKQRAIVAFKGCDGVQNIGV